MYLHLGNKTVIQTDKIVGIFDIDTTTVSSKTRDYLSSAEKEGRVVYVSTELPRSFIVDNDGIIYISPISATTLLQRA